jgi:hypothetical protein
MGVISRGTLPQNFLDSVSAEIELPTPQPQYFFAKMVLAGRLSLAALDAGADSVQQFVSMDGGGAKQSQEFDELVRAAEAYPTAITVVDQLFGLGKGDTIKMPRDIFEGGGYSAAERELKTEQTISTTGQTIKNEEVPMVLKEYIGPFPAGGSGTQPYAIWEFDAKYRRNKIALASKVSKHLKYDYTKWLDRVVRAQFLKPGNITWPDGITGAADFVPGGAAFISLEQILRARKRLTDREWAPFPNGRYMCLVPSSFNTEMVGDPDYRERSKLQKDRNQLYAYIGTVQDIDFFEVTTLAQYSDNGGDHFATLNGGSVGAGVVLDEAILFGPGAVGFGTAKAPECRWADDTNYGTVAKCIWYALHAMDCIDTRGVERIPFQGEDA